MTKECANHCGRSLSRDNRTGYCRRCAPGRRYDCPEYRARHAEKMRAVIAETKPWINGNKAMPKGSEPRRRGGINQSRTKLAHVPTDYRRMYRDIVSKGTPSSEALDAVLKHAEIERDRFRKELLGS